MAAYQFAELQWGHGPKAVETTTTLTIDAPCKVALQWGHGPKAVETDAI